VAVKWRCIFTAATAPRLIRQANSPQKEV